MSLPQELFDAIIDNLYGDIFSLKMCSLVSSAFCRSSQPHIFRRVTLEPWPMARKPTNSSRSTRSTMCFLFYQLITSSPHILLYVRILVIMDRPMLSTPGRVRPKSWILDEPTLPTLLALLPNLESLHLHARLGWEDLGDENPVLAAAILDALASPKIRSIHFRDMEFPSSCITQSPGATDILLNNNSILTDQTDSLVPKIPIRRLGLSPWTLAWFARDSCPFDITHLSKLRASPQHNVAQYASLQTLLNEASDSLLEFEYFPFLTIGDEPPYHHLDLSQLSSLRCFVAWVALGRFVGHPFAQALWLVRALDSLPPDSSIEHIVIYLPDWPVYESISKTDWATLDTSLTRLSLRAARVTIIKHAKLNLDRLLPVLASTGRMQADNEASGFSFNTFDLLRYADL
ncbi:hypothetical protein DFH06DRAFT_103824 [Mycena polygramma]|nr:hypothetical protein DFH06DRAFT_103824 [Mycena polygramma]